MFDTAALVDYYVSYAYVSSQRECPLTWRLMCLREYLARGSLYRLLHHTQVTLEFRRRLKMGIDISKGMAYLHSATPAIVHRDLKSPNLLVDENFTGELTLIVVLTRGLD